MVAMMLVAPSAATAVSSTGSFLVIAVGMVVLVSDDCGYRFFVPRFLVEMQRLGLTTLLVSDHHTSFLAFLYAICCKEA